MPKRQHVLALACYLAIPAALIAGTGLFLLIDPEMARGHADYVLEDRSPARDNRFQQFICKLKMFRRVPLEIAVWVSVWFLAFGSVLLERELLISEESLTTGQPAATIIAKQSASSGMWAFGEGLQVIYLVVLIYLLWPLFFNFADQLLKPRTKPTRQDSGDANK